MPYTNKRYQKSVSSASRSSQAKRRARASTATRDAATPVPPEIKTPKFGTKNGFNRIEQTSFGNRSSAHWTSDPAETQPANPHLPALKRVSLRPPTSYISSESVLISEVEDHTNEFDDHGKVLHGEEADGLNEIIMAIEMKDRGRLGCAYYVAREEKLYVMEDVQFASLDLVDTLKLHTQPTTLLINTRADEALENHLKREAKPNGTTDDESKILLSMSSIVLLINLCHRQHLRILCTQRPPSSGVLNRGCEE